MVRSPRLLAAIMEPRVGANKARPPTAALQRAILGHQAEANE
jgi:hypothetical protein